MELDLSNKTETYTTEVSVSNMDTHNTFQEEHRKKIIIYNISSPVPFGTQYLPTISEDKTFETFAKSHSTIEQNSPDTNANRGLKRKFSEIS